MPYDEHPVFRPTHLMQRASMAIEERPRELTKTALARQLGARKDSALKAIDALVGAGYAQTVPGNWGRAVYYAIRPYREERGPLCNQCGNQSPAPASPNPFPEPVPGSGEGTVGNRSQKGTDHKGEARPVDRPHGLPPGDPYVRIGLRRRPQARANA
jgi:hypothetical protein